MVKFPVVAGGPSPADVPVPQWHRDVLKARLESPATWLDWEQVKASLREMARQEGDAPNDHRDEKVGETKRGETLGSEGGCPDQRRIDQTPDVAPWPSPAEAPEQVVMVLAVGVKDRTRIIIGGEELER